MLKVAINGFGRIGRAAFKIILDGHPALKVAAVNDLTDVRTLAHLLKHDSVYGTYPKEIKVAKDSWMIDNQEIKVFARKDPALLPWKKLGVDVVLECTGFFMDKGSIAKHLSAGAKKVVVATSLNTEEKVPVFVPGVNEKGYDPNKDSIVSCASCTTNCVTPIIDLLNKNLGLEKCFFSTVHSYTSEQKLIDSPHQDLRRARAAAVSIIPTTTHASEAVAEILPELKGKIEASAYRVPVPIVSIADIIALISKRVSKEEVNEIFTKAAKKDLRGILDVSGEPLVSADYIKNPFSAVVDSELTQVNGNLVKVSAWYDNEWGHASRFVELAEYVGLVKSEK